MAKSEPDRGLLRRGRNTGNVDAQMTQHPANAEILTSARMAAGMTSRARRPMDFNSAG
ncbi:MAG TPA: hypothetical protein PLF10_04460 [Dokdonella sp.]|nr:hypothetical protein [Dokdonella sp.]